MAFNKVMTAVRSLITRTDESGQTLVEYSLIIGLIAIAAIIGITMVAGGVNSLWTWIGDSVGNAVDSVLSP
jgi:Flp pilus assembly pilin Flp